MCQYAAARIRLGEWGESCNDNRGVCWQEMDDYMKATAVLKPRGRSGIAGELQYWILVIGYAYCE